MNWSYIAGFFDGEGSLGLTNLGSNNCCFRVSMAQGTVPVLSKIQEFLAQEDIPCRIELNTNRFHMLTKKHKSVHQLRITVRKNVTKFCELVLPYCVVKKALVQDVGRFLKMYPPLNYKKHDLM